MTLVRLETEDLLGTDAADVNVTDGPLAVQLATAQAQVAGLEQIVVLLNERLGLADAQNIDLNKWLEESLTVVDRVTLALPAPSEATHRSWQFWKR